ncbi:MAG: peptidoglycan-binding protein LysM [Acidobacteriota bacterium]
MGLFSFVKDAGKSLFGNKEEEERIEKELEAKAQLQRERLAVLKKAKALENRISDMGLEITDADIDVAGGTVTLKGKAANQEAAEKIVLTVGNIEGVEAVDNQLEVENPEPEATFYTVVRGDTLSGIAKKHYGKASKYMVIFEANKPMLEDPDKIYPGQSLRIPALED